jgi:SAM-dependent methyltransferase
MIAGLRTVAAAVPAWFPSEAQLRAFLARRQPVYRYRAPRYVLRVLADLARLLPEGTLRLLDIGAGSGLLGEAIHSFFPGKRVTAVDTRHRALTDLRIAFAAFDGRRLPFADAAFDAALLCNVLHHVSPQWRLPLLREALRVTGGGPLLIKDHLARSALDRLRLGWLDVAGNLPFGGMVWARYLAPGEWAQLLGELGCSGVVLPVAAYRSGLPALCFPNRLELCFSVTQDASRAA